MLMAILLLFMAIYAAMHLYAYWKITAAFPRFRATKPVLGLVFAIMATMPFLARMLDHDGHIGLARAVNLPTYLWAAWVFWFLMCGLVFDTWNGLIRLVAVKVPALKRLRFTLSQQAPVLLVIILLASTWGMVEAAQPRVKLVALHHRAFVGHPIRLVMVSDVHLGVLRSPGWNKRVCETITSLHPDVVVSAGDLVDSSMGNIGTLADSWAAIPAPLGKYAILGNHEYYLGMTDALAFHKRAGFHLLRAETANLTPYLRLSGVDDRNGLHLGGPCYTDESQLILTPEPDIYAILLKHQPYVTKESIPCFNLQLSGHTHNGQLFPFHLLVRLLYPHNHGLYELQPNFSLYVSAGTGTWGPPMRLFAPPEITLITLNPPAAAKR